MRIKLILLSVLSIFCALALSSCGGNTSAVTETAEENEITVYAMDTVMTLKAYGNESDAALSDAEGEITRLDEALDRNNAQGEIYAINTAGSAEVSDETAELISDALDICKKTDGAFDITVAPIMDLWGFYTKEYHVPTSGELTEALKLVDYKNVSVDGNTVSVKNGAKIDLGGIAKGYASARVNEIFKEHDVSGIMSLGGNVQAVGKKSDGSDWKVGIQSPDDNSFIGTIAVSDKAVITSGGYQRYFESDGKVYHHIIDPADGSPAESGLKSVTIVGSDGTTADGLSTALFVMGLEGASDFWRESKDFDAVFCTDDNKIYITEGLKDSFNSEDDYTIIK